VSAVLRSEVRKITTTRLWWIMLICVFLLAGCYASLPGVVAVLQHRSASAGSPSPFSDPGTIRSIYNGGNTVARIIAMVIGITAFGSEYRHHTLATTYLATPRRVRVLMGKVGSLLAFGLLYGVASVTAGLLVAIPFVLANGGTFALDQPATWRSLVLGVLSIALWTMIGMGIGILIKNMLVAMLVGISFAYLVEPIVSVVFFLRKWDLVLNLMPSGATNAMLGTTSPVLFAGQHPYPWWQGALVLAGWCLLPAVVGVVSTVRQDVN
jgi:ABC-type transport system involved in multi-copper enzyme maturation permease subunit